MNQGGFALQIPRPELYYELLPVHQVKVHADRGVKIGGLWYGRADPALKPYEGKRSARGGQRKGEWVIRSDRRDRRQVFFQDPVLPDTQDERGGVIAGERVHDVNGPARRSRAGPGVQGVAVMLSLSR
jgi:hypothetical protein